jgi:crotonobetainyl-CoA:carnitine CoA-transferase CaiB-like acyl-CoA transferase
MASGVHRCAQLTGTDGGPGLPVPMQVADIAGASYGAQAVLAALLARERSGRGAHIELSLAECVLQWLGVVDRTGSLAPPATLVLETADGERVLVQAIMHFHPRLAELVDAVPGCEDSRSIHATDRETRPTVRGGGATRVPFALTCRVVGRSARGWCARGARPSCRRGALAPTARAS